MAKTTGPTQADILLNENAILAARSQRLLQSLLGPPTNGAHAKTEEELEEEDAEVFQPGPDELLGPGFPTAENGGPLSSMQIGQSLRADEKLRKHMLGKNAKRPVSGVTSSGRLGKTAASNLNVPTKPKPVTTNRSAESDEEEGRSSLGKTKRRKTEQTILGEGKEKGDREGEHGTVPEVAKTVQMPVVMKTKETGSYLDEILSERSKKREKLKRKKGAGST